jgi:hypothetical protein
MKKHNYQHTKAVKAAAVEAGKCAHCYKPRGENGTMTLCRSCADKQKARDRNRRAGLRPATNEEEMNSENAVKINRKGHIYFCSKVTKALCITDWKWLKIIPCVEHILVRICKTTVTSDVGSYVVSFKRAHEYGIPMRGSCIEFADKLAARFGEFHSLELRYAVVSRDANEVLIIVDNPPFQSTPGSDGSRSIPEQEEEVEAWFAESGAEQEKSLGTISIPVRPPASDNPASRPLPEDTPDWLRIPMTKGLHVKVITKVTREHGWAIGVFSSTVSGRTLVAVSFDDRYQCVLYHLAELSPTSTHEPVAPRFLKPAAECFTIAEELSIFLSPLQIKAINSGVIPIENHGLPDEMFE